MDKHYLTPLFCPEIVAVFAGRADDPATQTRHARLLHQALRAQHFGGTLHFLDIQTSGTLADLAKARADLAIIALPPADIAAALELAGRMACRSALILGNGLSAEQAAVLKAIARREGIALLGPNSLGLQRPQLQLNASVIGPLAADGPLALVSQSGALTVAMLDWGRQNGVGFSSVVSVGPHTGIDIAEVLDFLATDGRTHSIIVYLEGISSARRFMSALRSAAHSKPVVVLKSGRRSGGNDAAQTHSGAIVGSDEVFDAALRRAGAVRVRSFVELFSAAKCLASRYRPVGRRLAVVSNGGGPGVLAADWAAEIEPPRASDLTADQLLLTCDKMTANDLGAAGAPPSVAGAKPDSAATIELQALGNARIDAQRFTAEGDRLIYSAGKQLLTLEGAGQADAHLWQKGPNGESTSHAAARKILYWRATNRVQVQDIRNIDLNQLGRSR